MFDLLTRDNALYTEYRVALPFLFILIGTVIVVSVDPYIKKRDKRVLLTIIVMTFSLLVQNMIDYALDQYIPMPYLRTVAAIYGYTVRPFIILLFCNLIGEKRRFIPLWILVGINAAVHFTALFSEICFYITEDNHFMRGPLSITCYVVSVIMLAYLVYLSFQKSSRTRKAERLILMFNVLVVVTALCVGLFVDVNNRAVTDLTMAITICTVFYYIWLHLRFVRDHEQALLAEQRIQIMMTQIQPHFLYNTLSTIQALCRIDPEKAFTITERFGTYLRQNIDSLSQPNLIPVKKELEHTKIYSDIESVRFDNITVVYDTPETGFSVPALTIQPLVENAIRHGVRTREKGIVCISTAKADGGYEIVIEDNGKGFDTALTEKTDGTHIGISNVRERLRSMCGGTMKLESTKDIGTKITICIPR